MIPRLALIALAAVSVGTGAAAGALLFTPVISGAQTDTTVEDSTTDDSADDESGTGEGRCGHGLLRGGLDTAAEAIGISTDELREALQDGETIAEVAEANDVDGQTVIDALVADHEARLDQLVADGRIDEDRAAELKEALPERVTAMVNGEGPLGFRGPGFRHHHRGGPGSFDSPVGDGDEASDASVELTRV